MKRRIISFVTKNDGINDQVAFLFEIEKNEIIIKQQMV